MLFSKKSKDAAFCCICPNIYSIPKLRKCLDFLNLIPTQQNSLQSISIITLYPDDLKWHPLLLRVDFILTQKANIIMSYLYQSLPCILMTWSDIPSLLGLTSFWRKKLGRKSVCRSSGPPWRASSTWPGSTLKFFILFDPFVWKWSI